MFGRNDSNTTSPACSVSGRGGSFLRVRFGSEGQVVDDVGFVEEIIVEERSEVCGDCEADFAFCVLVVVVS